MASHAIPSVSVDRNFSNFASVHLPLRVLRIVAAQLPARPQEGAYVLSENLIKLSALPGLAPPNINSRGHGRRVVDLFLTASAPGTTPPNPIKMILAEPHLIDRSPIMNSPKV